VLPIESDAAQEELTRRLVCAMADEIRRLCSRHSRLDWLEVEAALAAMAGQARAEAGEAIFVRASGGAGAAGGTGDAAPWRPAAMQAAGRAAGAKPARALVEAR
jgi:hypothetical protein